MEFLFNNKLLFGEETLNILHLFIGTWFDYFMVAITRLGNQTFFMLLFPILYWCYDKKITLKTSIIFFISIIFSDNIKEFFSHPRPDPALLQEHIAYLAKKFASKQIQGFPSSHTIGAVTCWGSLAYYIRKRQVIVTCLLLIILIPYSRIFLGVHYLGDVSGGYFIGIISMLILLPLINLIEINYHKVNSYIIIGSSLIIPIFLAIILKGHYLYPVLGVISGMFFSVCIYNNFFQFEPQNHISASIIKIIFGISGVFLLRIGLKAILPDHPASIYLRYWLIGFWIFFLAPLIFSKFKMLRGDVNLNGIEEG